MHNKNNTIPVSTSLGNPNQQVNGRAAKRTPAVGKRVFYLSLQVVGNAIVIGVIAKGLVYLIDFITNISFYGRFSFEAASPADNQLGLLVIAVPIIGAVLVGFMARFGSRAIGGHGIPEAMEKIILDCDPGHDDAIAILLAAGNPISDLLGITTVSGNHNVENTTRNALSVCAAYGIEVPVAKELLADLLKWFRATDAKLPTKPNPDYDPKATAPKKKGKK